tara:strand:- start:579 stop:800 length:222 start_codon:yes stop_codon:yes gene_type:complete
MQIKKDNLLWWIIIVLAILVVGYFLLGFSGDDSNYEGSEQESAIDEIKDEEFEDIETTDQILNEIDDSLNYFE